MALAEELSLPIGDLLFSSFPDGERRICFRDALVGQLALIVVSTGPPVDSNTIALALLADAARRGGARTIAIVPYLGYSRSERLSQPGGPIAGRVAADILEHAGFEAIVTLDLHSPAIAGFFHTPLLEGRAVEVLARSFLQARDAVAVAPDSGAVRRATDFANRLGLPLAIALKERLPSLEARALALCGEVRGRSAILVDDMVTTGGTLVKAAELLWAHGALSIEAAATHPVLVEGALERLAAAGIRRLVTTDTLPRPTVCPPGIELEVVSVAPSLAQLIRPLVTSK